MVRLQVSCLFASVTGALSHAYMTKPTSRAEIHCNAAGEPMWGGDGCLNHRSSATTNIKWPELPGDRPGEGIIPEPVCSGPGSPMRQDLIDKLNTAGDVGDRVFQAGQLIDVGFNMQANHHGKYAYRLCTDGTDKEECFKKNYLQFEDGETWKGVTDGQLNDRVRLPDNVACDRCTLSLRWDAGKDENQVWVYCSDIKIEGSGGATPPATPTDAPGGSTPTEAPGSGSDSDTSTTTEAETMTTAAPCQGGGAGAQPRRALRVEINDPACGDLVNAASGCGAFFAFLLAFLVSLR